MSKETVDRKGGSPSPLNEGVERIVRELARGVTLAEAANSESQSELEVSQALVRWTLDASKGRSHYLPGEFVSNPVWCMLLELLLAEIRLVPVTLSELSGSGFTSESCAARWVKALEDGGLLARRENQGKQGGPSVGLTPMASNALRLYFRDLKKSLSRLST